MELITYVSNILDATVKASSGAGSTLWSYNGGLKWVIERNRYYGIEIQTFL